MKWSEVLSVVSSVASITGMSLITAGTMLSSENPRQIAWMVVSAMCGAMLSIGCLTGLVQLLLFWDRAYAKQEHPSIRFMFWCFAGAVSLLVSLFFLTGIWYVLEDAWAIKFR